MPAVSQPAGGRGALDGGQCLVRAALWGSACKLQSPAAPNTWRVGQCITRAHPFRVHVAAHRWPSPPPRPAAAARAGPSSAARGPCVPGSGRPPAGASTARASRAMPLRARDQEGTPLCDHTLVGAAKRHVRRHRHMIDKGTVFSRTEDGQPAARRTPGLTRVQAAISLLGK